MEIVEIVSLALMGIAIQFVAAILGPGVLRFASILLVGISLAIAAYLAYMTVTAQFAGVGQDAMSLGINFAVLGALLWVGHLLMRKWFMAMARAARA